MFSPKIRLALAIAVAIASWSLAWVSIRAAVTHYSAGELALGRYLVASLCLLPFWLRRRPRFERRDFPLLLGAAICGFTIYNLAINEGEKTITAGAAAFVASTIPIFATLCAHFLLGERAKSATYVGGAIALAGVFLIALGEDRSAGSWSEALGQFSLSKGAILVLIASVSAAFYNVFQKKLFRKYSALDVTCAAIFLAVLTFLPFGWTLPAAVQSAPAPATWHLIILGVFPGALGYVLWSWALSQLSVARLVPFLYLIAPLSIPLGYVLLGELPSSLALVGGALSLFGVLFAARK